MKGNVVFSAQNSDWLLWTNFPIKGEQLGNYLALSRPISPLSPQQSVPVFATLLPW